MRVLGVLLVVWPAWPVLTSMMLRPLPFSPRTARGCEIVYPFESDADTLWLTMRVNMGAVPNYTNLGVTAANAFTGIFQPMIPMWNSIVM